MLQAASLTFPTHSRLTGAIYRRAALFHGFGVRRAPSKGDCEINKFTICSRRALESDPRNEPFMADQIVITEKTSQARDIRAAVGSRYGDILPAEGHLFDLLEPEDVVPAWKRWSPILLRPEGLYGTRPAEGGNKAAKLKAIREALRKVSGSGSPPTAIARVSSSVGKSSSITSTAARSCG